MFPVIATLGVLAVGYWLLMQRTKARHSKMTAARQGVNVESFIKEFEGTPYGRPALEAAYADLTNLAHVPVRRSDDLEKTLGFLPEDFDDMLEKRCRSLGLVDVGKSPHAALFPLKTVEDYVRFLAAIMKEQGK